MKWAALTTPPAPRPPPPKHPLFTTKVFSTKSFGPGHLVGAGLLVLGAVGIGKLLVSRGQAEAERARRQAGRQPDVSASVENTRGQYGGR